MMHDRKVVYSNNGSVKDDFNYNFIPKKKSTKRSPNRDLEDLDEVNKPIQVNFYDNDDEDQDELERIESYTLEQQAKMKAPNCIIETGSYDWFIFDCV